VIAEWCAVKLSTAHAYKSGRLKPGASVLKLWRLYVDRQVLTVEWKGWLVKGRWLTVALQTTLILN
jgi:hypothetical protein